MQTASLSNPPRCSDFKTAFQQLVSGASFSRLPPREGSTLGRPPKLKVRELVMGLVFHCWQASGTLAQNIRILLCKQMAESSLSERRQNLPWQVFTALMQAALRPKVTRQKHPQAFYNKWRLVAMDGTQFSVGNTPQVLGSLRKAHRGADATARRCWNIRRSS